MTVGAGTILTVDVPSALATMSHALTVNLFRTPAAACNTTLTTDVRGSVVVSISGVPGNPALDKLTLVVTLIAHTVLLRPEVFDIAINCGASIGTITTGATGAGGPTTVTTTVAAGQISAISVTPRTQQPPITIYVARPSCSWIRCCVTLTTARRSCGWRQMFRARSRCSGIELIRCT